MSVFNTQKQCRCCLGLKRNMKDMYKTFLFDKKSEKIKLIDGYFTFLQNGKTAPKNKNKECFLMCKPCLLQLKTSFSFRELCKKSDELIQSSASSIKKELVPCPSYTVEEEKDDRKEKELVLCPPFTPEAEQNTEMIEPKLEVLSDNDYDIPDTFDQCNDSDSVDVKPALEISGSFKSTETAGCSPPKTEEKIADIDEITGTWIEPIPKPEEKIKLDEVLQENTGSDGHYYCLYCDENFEYLADLQFHRRKRHSLKQYRLRKKCLLCPKVDLQNYEGHMQTSHPEFQPNKCVLCPQTYQNYQDLKSHMNVHAAGYTYKCQDCSSYFKSAKYLRQHIQFTAHGNKPNKNYYNCHICGMIFEKIIPLSEHIKKDHPGDLERKYWPCFYCKQIFLTQERHANDWKGLCSRTKKKIDTNHIKNGNLDPPFSCESCNTKYYDEEERDCHVVSVHLEAKPRYFCSICNLKFRISKELKKHNNQKHKTIALKTNNVFMCDICAKFFPSKCLLKRHSIKHNDIRPYECPTENCGMRFKSRDALKSHLAAAHVTEKNYECNECEKKFKARMFVKKHLLSHFPALRMCVCNHCGKRFETKLQLKRHFRMHTGEKDFSCTMCNKAYAFQTGLQQHITSNHTSIRYECKFCDKKLAIKKSMWKHIFTHRGYYPFYCPVCNYGCYPKELMKRHLKNKHNVTYDDKVHGYHKETFDEVIASGIKIDANNLSNFRPNQVDLNTNINYLNSMTVENEMSDDSTSTPKHSNNMEHVDQAVVAPFVEFAYKHEY